MPGNPATEYLVLQAFRDAVVVLRKVQVPVSHTERSRGNSLSPFAVQ
jgi:hypothetical protein